MKVLAGLALLFLLSSCSTVEEPESFDFILSYGVLYKNQIDTVHNRYSKDLVIDGVVTTDLALTDEEKQRVYGKMKEIDLFDYPDDVEGMTIKPQMGYNFEILLNGETQHVNWKGAFRETKRDLAFQELVVMIEEIVQSKSEYQSLPEANGYYE